MLDVETTGGFLIREPIMAGAKRRRSSYKRRYKRRRGSYNKQIARICRRTIARSLETKTYTKYRTIPNIQSDDNTFLQNLEMMTGIARGEDINEREGNRIRVKNIFLQGWVHAGDDTVETAQYVRVVIFWYNSDLTDPVTAGFPLVPKLPQLFAGTADLGTARMWQPRNLTYMNTWVIIYDRRIKLFDGNGYAAKLMINLRLNHLVSYTGGDGLNYLDNRKGTLWLGCYSTSLAAPHPTMEYVYRVRYNDD